MLVKIKTMEKEMTKRLEKFGRVETDSKTWVHPWETYWRLYCKKHHGLLVKILSKMYPNYTFSLGESHICGTIFKVIIINKKY